MEFGIHVHGMPSHDHASEFEIRHSCKINKNRNYVLKHTKRFCSIVMGSNAKIMKIVLI